MQSSGAVKRFWRPGRAWDVVALCVVAFALWKMFFLPRSFAAPRAVPAPHVTYALLDGGTFRLNQQRGRLVFLDFYASWCGPCRFELPLVEAWRNAHPNVLVVPVDVGESPPTAAAFARRMQLHSVALDPTGGASASFALNGFPTLVVVDGAGYVRAKWEGLNPAIGLAMTNAAKSL